MVLMHDIFPPAFCEAAFVKQTTPSLPQDASVMNQNFRNPNDMRLESCYEMHMNAIRGCQVLLV